MLVLESSTRSQVESILAELVSQRGWQPHRSAVIVWCLGPPQAGPVRSPQGLHEGEAAAEEAPPVPPGFRELHDVEPLVSGGRYFLRAHRRAWFEGTRLRLGSRAPGDHRPIDRLLLSLAEGWGSESVAVQAASIDDEDGECGLRIVRAVGGIAVRRALPSGVWLGATVASSGVAPASDEAVARARPSDPERSAASGRDARTARVFSIPSNGVSAALAACASLIRRPGEGGRIRVWQPACKAGGLTYAVAMLLLEAARRSPSEASILVFGTDADEAALALARAGRYPTGAALGMEPELRGRYTFDEGETIRVSEALRNVCIFKRHELGVDVPMARMDLIVSHGVFDGLDERECQRVVDVFHYSLREGGLLLALDRQELFPEHRFERLQAGCLRARRERASSPAASSAPLAVAARALPPPLSFGQLGAEELLQAIALPVLWFDEQLRLVLASREAETAFGLAPEHRGSEFAEIAGQLPAGLDLVTPARQALAERAPRELMVRSRQQAYLVRLAVAAHGGGLSLMVAFTDVTPLELAKARAVAQHHRQAAIARLSELALNPGEPSAIYEEAMAVLFGHVHACAAGIIAEKGAAGAFDVLASRGLGLDALGALQRMGDAAALLNAVVEQACVVSQSGERAAWGGPTRARADGPRAARSHPRASVATRGVGCPILVEGRVLGVIALFGRHAGVDDPEYQPFLQAVCNVLAGAITRQRTRRRLALELEASRALASATSLESGGVGLHPALSAALAVDEVELWGASEAVSGNSGASSAASPAAGAPTANGFVAVRLWSSAGGEKALAPASLAALLGGSAPQAAPLQGGRRELCIPVEPRNEPRCLLVLRGAHLREPDPELAEGIASVARMLATFLERLHILAQSRQNEAAYRQKSAELEALYASLPVGISIHDQRGKVRHINRYLADLESVGASPASHALRRLYAEELPAWVARVIELDDPIHDIELFVSEGGRTWSWLCNFAPIRDDAGRLHGASAVVQDITAIKRVEASLREADHRKDDFLALLGHELRNPVAALGSATELLGRLESPTPQLLRIHGIFERQTQQATKLIDGLIDVARIARDKVELDLAPLPLAQVVRQVLEDHEQQFGNRAVELHFPDEEIWLQGDRPRLTQVLDNLLSNALKFTRPDGRIGIAVKRSGRQGVIRVEDDGAGIEPELLPHIFEPFRQGGTKSSRHAGLGLGLALVKGLLDLHGFELRASSDGKGLGACFEILFPLAAEPDAPAPPSRIDTRVLDLLLVEDNADIAETLGELLGAEGHRVRSVETAEAALLAIAERRPDVMLCDIGLPGMSGLELASHVRADPSLAAVKLVAITGYGDAAARAHMARAGFDRTLIKPVQLGALRHCLERVAAAAPPSPPDHGGPLANG